MPELAPRLPSKKDLRDEERKQKLADLQSQKYTLSSCVWTKSKIGGKRKSRRFHPLYCCAQKRCNQHFESALGREELAVLIGQVRRHYHALDDEQQRAWWSQHTVYDGYTEGKNLGKNARLNDFFCENPAALKQRYGGDTSKVFPRLKQEDTLWCCQSWLVFLCGGNNNRFYDCNLRKAAHLKPEGPHPTDFDVCIPPKRDSCGLARPSEKKALTIAFLLEQAELAEHLPNERSVVLPFRTVMHTHYYLVCMEERLHGAAWADSTETILERQKAHDRKDKWLEKKLKRAAGFDECKYAAGHRVQSPDDDGEDPSEDPDEPEEPDEPANQSNDDHVHLDEDAADDEDEEDEEAALKRAVEEWEKGRKKYRYGNRLCGERTPTSAPELKHIVGYSYFASCWWRTPEVRHIVCREHLPFAKCSKCVRGRDLSVLGKSKDERKEHKDDFLKHLNEVYNEKLMYYSNRIRCRMHPDKYLSLIIDGSDQSKTTLPHCCEHSHLAEDTKNLKTHVYGCLAHGRRAYAFIVGDHVKQGHNTTIQVIHEVLLDTIKREGKLPKTLFLQLDNTCRQNKGQYLFAYLACLVHLGWFEYVYVNYLPVGHTHEDIDQMFSRFCMGLRFLNAYTQEDLVDVIRDSFTFESEKPTVKIWDTIANMSGFLAHYTNDFADGCTQFRHFRFFRSGTDNQVWMQNASKMCSADDPADVWRGLKEYRTHDLPFDPKTGFGVPDIMESFTKDELPPAEKRTVKLATLDQWEKAIRHFHTLQQSFTDEHLERTLALVENFRDEPAQWPWSSEDMKQLYTPLRDGDDPSKHAAQYFAVPHLLVGKFYIVVAPKGLKLPFYICRVKSLRTQDEIPGARVQWFMPEDAENPDPYRGLYLPELQHRPTRRYDTQPTQPLTTIHPLT